jgi:hypothetical protein
VLDVGDLRGSLEGLGSGEAAVLDEVLLDGEARAWGSGGGRAEETVKWGDGSSGGRR